jgi:hypothetical protein
LTAMSVGSLLSSSNSLAPIGPATDLFPTKGPGGCRTIFFELFNIEQPLHFAHRML